MNHKKNQKLRRLAYFITVNLLCDEDFRKTLLKQTNFDVLAKLVRILENNSQDNRTNSSEEIINALKALSNAL